MIKAVIFDLDGVLVEGAEKMHYAVWKRFFGERKIMLNKEIYNRYIGMSPGSIVKDMHEKKGIVLSKKEIAMLAKEKDRIYLSIALAKLKPEKRTLSLLKSLKKEGYRLGLATSAQRDVAEVQTRKIGVREYFDSTVTASDVRNGKPNPEVFLKSAKLLGISPKECMVIEDARNGIEAAKKAGMKCIALETTHKKSELEKADLIVKNMAGLTLEMIRGLENGK